MDKRLPTLLITALIVLAVLLTYQLTVNIASTRSTTTPTSIEEPIPINRFSSYKELEQFVEESMKDYRLTYFDSIATPLTLERAPTPLLSAKGKANIKSTLEYSTTNVQVEGVDEADIVKTDGEYVYAVSRNEVVIVNAYPPSNAEVISRINITSGVGETIKGLFIGEDRLTVVSSVCDVAIEPEIATVPTPPKPQHYLNTSIYIYDTSNIKNPTLLTKVTASGFYVTSRMIKDYCYVIITFPIVKLNDTIMLPVVNGEAVKPSEIGYFEKGGSYMFTLIVLVNVKTCRYTKETFLTSSSSYIYASPRNIYITCTKWIDIHDIYSKAIDVIIRDAPLEIISKVEEIRAQQLPKPKIVSETLKVVSSWFNSLDNKERLEKVEEAEKVVANLWIEETVIYRFSIDRLKIVARANGSIPGTILDQFSMDEYNNYFRVATTKHSYKNPSSNNVYVLDLNLNVIGKLEDLAVGERIYAARYIGDKMFLVTFRRVDPLFAIDLSNPKEPKVIGKLKIPGFSEYLHPYRSYLIGVGRDADEQGRVKGLKISLFDISNPVELVEVSAVTIEGAWVNTPVLYDHKAFLINPKAKYIAIPVHEGKGGGAYIIDINGKLTVRGVVKHEMVQRILYIDNYIYTVSEKTVKIVDSSLKVIAEIPLTL